MAFPIIPKKRSGSAGNPTSLQLGELATNTATGELFLGGDAGVMLLNAPTSAGTTVTEHIGDGSTVAFTFTGYSTNADGAYIVSVGGIDQPPSKYSINNTNGGTITFVEAPVAGELISIRAIVAGGGGGGSGDATSLQGIAISSTAPSTSQALVYDGSQWVPSAVNAAQLQGQPVNASVPLAGDYLYFDGSKWASAAISTGNAFQLQGVPITGTYPTSGQGLVFDGLNWTPATPTANATQLQGIPVSLESPTASQVLQYDTIEWKPVTLPSPLELSTTPAANLASAGSAGTGTTAARSDHQHAFPSASQVGALGATAAAGGDLTGNFPNPTLAAITTAQTVGSATQVPVVTVDAKGRVTGMTTAANPQGTVTSVVGGTGLTGGTITSSGTLAVSYGTTAGTAAQGNDSRLSDSRTPTGAAGGDLTGTYPNPTLNTVAVAKGGTGQTSFTDGQLLIGNSTGNTLSKATLTAGSGVTITNGPGTITIGATGSAGISATILCVAGGGGGGSQVTGVCNGGGGGAGGVVEQSQTLSSGTTYAITVGAGGAIDNNGQNSSFGTLITAIGGGKGGGLASGTGGIGGSGGSGGGGVASGTASAGGSGTAGQGFAGGLGGSSSNFVGGGGGGASIAGATGAAGGAGGNGKASTITGTSVTYGGGGGGGGNSGAFGAGGTGGGGRGGTNVANSAVAGTANTGGGGGASAGSFGPAAAGGSGVVIVSVPTSSYTGLTTGSPVVTTSGSNTILQFNSSGSYTA